MPPGKPETEFVGAPREREIELFAKVVRVFLRAGRVLFAVVGAAAIAASVYALADPAVVYSEADPLPPLSARIAHGAVWWCLGIPLLVPVRWLFGRGRWPMLALGLLLWLLPMLLAGDPAYCFVIRFFASFVAVSVLAVWRTLYALARPASP